jgi:membrane protein
VEGPAETSEQFNADEQLFQLMRETLSDDAADQIEDTLRRLNEQGASASLIGFLLLAWTASRAFGGLYRAFQIIWGVEDQEPQQPGVLGMVTGFVRKKVLAFLLVLGCGALLLVSMLTSVAITTVSTYAPSLPGDWVFWRGVQVGVTITILALVFMLLFKYLPDTHVSWGDVWIGGLLTAVLFTLLQQVSSLVIGGGDYQSYGAVGGIMALLLWIYLSSQALFAGVEFTQVYAHMYGSHRPRTDEHALKLASAAQAGLATEVLEDGEGKRQTER